MIQILESLNFAIQMRDYNKFKVRGLIINILESFKFAIKMRDFNEFKVRGLILKILDSLWTPLMKLMDNDIYLV